MYRKLLGDRTWNTDERFSDLVSYFPAPVVALRTCKSPLAVGLLPGHAPAPAAAAAAAAAAAVRLLNQSNIEQQQL